MLVSQEIVEIEDHRFKLFIIHLTCTLDANISIIKPGLEISNFCGTATLALHWFVSTSSILRVSTQQDYLHNSVAYMAYPREQQVCPC